MTQGGNRSSRKNVKICEFELSRRSPNRGFSLGRRYFFPREAVKTANFEKLIKRYVL